jgi:hypothetical protein
VYGCIGPIRFASTILLPNLKELANVAVPTLEIKVYEQQQHVYLIGLFVAKLSLNIKCDFHC